MSDKQERKSFVDKTTGKGALYSPKGHYYMHRRENPKSGIRKATKAEFRRRDKGMSLLFPNDPCVSCGTEMLIKRSLCDDCNPNVRIPPNMQK